MRIIESLKYPFRSEQWFVNLLLTAVCFLIPVLGPLVIHGYSAYLERRLTRDVNDIPPKFDFSDFMKHLERGVAPFVVSLVGTLVLMPVMVVLYAVMMVAIIASHGHEV